MASCRALDRRLVDRDSQIIKLLAPPFDQSSLNPGYIKGYVPGVRENGGQYTHAAIWAAMAFARLGDSRRSWEFFNMINPINHAKTPEDSARLARGYLTLAGDAIEQDQYEAAEGHRLLAVCQRQGGCLRAARITFHKFRSGLEGPDAWSYHNA